LDEERRGGEKANEASHEQYPARVLGGMSNHSNEVASVVRGKGGEGEITSGSRGSDDHQEFPRWIIQYSCRRKERAGWEREWNEG
jgi:hypothetical protein